ncbi:conserved Plasmodium protein, unknown function [Babesia microti strain RI]|uniref:Uncharacterized protein n=1 Tax=Babesia microti (strain RI) TaxID=1133968 RepID=A0A0K3ALJ0_BABMR|nr:conserved Plasmodium protein, unknown function [Babesia microti strain RI]CTQ40619.1 conserved Plasmodium protein, unknown function [Babesia microti strain RI]|eukprot:XP_012648630.1 conserved Plasmodium protein, unknown function [Babesia microti strain RI]
MLNFLPLTCPSHNLLFNKGSFQRIVVGKSKNVLQVDNGTITSLFKNIRSDVLLHNSSYAPLKHRNFMELKLAAYRLIEAHDHPELCHKTSIKDVSWFNMIRDSYISQVYNLEADIVKHIKPTKLKYLIETNM